MAKVYRLSNAQQPFRLCCPECSAVWSTMEVPAYCPVDECGVLVTFRTIKWTARELRKADGAAKKLHTYLKGEHGPHEQTVSTK